MALPQGPMKSVGEVSSLVSPRDGIAPAQNWKGIADARTRAQALTDRASIAATKAAKGAITYEVDYAMHPFKVYSLPAQQREILQPDFDLSTNFRTFRVRGGGVWLQTGGPSGAGTINAGFGTIVGSDQIGLPGPPYNQPADSNCFIPLYNRPSDPQPTDFVLEFTSNIGVAYLKFAEDFTFQVKVSYDPYADGWLNYPSPNPYFKLLAEIDFAQPFAYAPTYFPETQWYAPWIKQYVRDSFDFTPPPTNYGEWQASHSIFDLGYPLNAMVYADRDAKVATYISTSWFNTSTPEGGSWQIIGEYEP